MCCSSSLPLSLRSRFLRSTLYVAKRERGERERGERKRGGEVGEEKRRERREVFVVQRYVFVVDVYLDIISF